MSAPGHSLRREIGIPGAVTLGLGSMIGTGVFVSLAFAIEVVGPGILYAVLIAGLLAMCNGLSSAQLAAAHPVSGGSYEYGYRYLAPWVGFLAGWMFLVAKSASAATAALGFSAYLIYGLGIDMARAWVPIAAATVLLLSLVAWTGVKKTNIANLLLLVCTIGGLLLFMGQSLTAPAFVPDPVAPIGASFGLRDLGFASALVFVAFTGYGRIATLGEEIKDPTRSIPVAVVVTVLLTLAIYLGVSFSCLHVAGVTATSIAFDQKVAAVAVIAKQHLGARTALWVSVAAGTAMLGVLLNLVLGLSRIVLAMARRRDLPAPLATLNAAQTSPSRAVGLVAVVLLGWVMVKDIRMTWSVSALTVLIYYGIANLAALKVPAEQRFIPRSVSVLGLLGCVSLAAMVDRTSWIIGSAILVVGLCGFWAKQRYLKA